MRLIDFIDDRVYCTALQPLRHEIRYCTVTVKLKCPPLPLDGARAVRMQRMFTSTHGYTQWKRNGIYLEIDSMVMVSLH